MKSSLSRTSESVNDGTQFLMSLCLITDAWIPVLRDGETVSIRPDQIAEAGLNRTEMAKA